MSVMSRTLLPICVSVSSSVCSSLNGIRKKTLYKIYELSFTVKRLKKRQEHSFGGDEVQQMENMLQKEAYRTLKDAKAQVRAKKWRR